MFEDNNIKNYLYKCSNAELDGLFLEVSIYERKGRLLDGIIVNLSDEGKGNISDIVSKIKSEIAKRWYLNRLNNQAITK